MATQYLNDAAMVTIGRVGSATDLITQQFIQIDDYRKRDLILDLLWTHSTAKRILYTCIYIYISLTYVS